MVDTPEVFFLTNNLKMKSSKNLTIIDWIFTTKPQHYGLIPGFGFPTGIFLFIVLLAMYIFSVKYVRKGGYFEVKFIYSEKATKFCEIFPLLLTTVHTVKSKGKISKNCVAFSEYMNFTYSEFFNKRGVVICT